MQSKKFDSLKPMLEGIEASNEKDFEERRERLRSALRQTKAGALLVAGTASLRYFTGVSWGISDRFFGALLFENSGPVFLTPAFERARAEERIPKGMDIFAWEEDEDPMRLAGDILRSRGAGEASIAFEVETPYRYLERFQSANPSLQVSSGFEAVRRCRMRKTSKEIAIMRRANEITKIAIREAAKHLGEGTTEAEFSGWVAEAQRKMGLSNVWVIGLFGPNAAYPHGTQEKRKLRKGDVVLCDTGGELFGYQSDVTRSWVFGKPSDRQRKVWDAVKNSQTAALETARPGVPCEDVDRAARRAIEEAGFGSDYKSFHHRLGHGIGLEGHEEPYFVRGNKPPLESGMTISDEPGIYIYGELGVRIEDILCVTESGAEFFGPPSLSIENPL